MPQDGKLGEIKVRGPIKGLLDGVDPALPDDQYPPTHAPSMENIRVSDGTWKTRAGSSLFKTLGGSGDVRGLWHHYENDGTRIRLAARGTGAAATLYDYVEGTDSSFNATSGGTSLGGTAHPYFTGTPLNDRFYFTDRAGALRRYEEAPSSGNQVRTVAQPTAPSAAPTCRARFWLRYDASSFGTNSANFAVSDDIANTYNPIGSSTSTNSLPTALFDILSTSAKGERLTKSAFVTAQNPPNTHQVALWVKQSSTKTRYQVELGPTTYDFTGVIQVPEADKWFPWFMDVGDLGEISRIGVRCIESSAVDELFTSVVVYPGKLAGKYRWVYTHYDSTTGRESEPSGISNSGQPMDFPVKGESYKNETARAMQKCCAMHFTSDSGTDSTTNQIRIYRNGGVPSLTKDSRTNQDIWLRVASVADFATTLAGNIAIGGTSFSLSAAPGQTIPIGTWFVIGPGTSAEEWVRTTTAITSVGTSASFALANGPNGAAGYAHSIGDVIKIGYIDNVANEEINVTNRVDLERDDPPSASLFISKAPDGRLWLFGPDMSVAVSNRATPDRPEDYEVFPDGVDPLTRQSLLQGWRFQINGDIDDQKIVWGGFFNGTAHVLTRKNLYRINALSQRDWGPSAVQKRHAVGCIAGDTVAEVNGILYWVADGPRVVRWDGQGPPQVISHQTINTTLSAAPTAYWNQWYATAHARKEGQYYCLFMTKSGQTTNTVRLDWNADQEAWEPMRYTNSAGTTLAWRGAAVRDSGADVHEMYQIASDGTIYLTETGSTDDGASIPISFSTKRFTMDFVSLIRFVYTRLAAVTDSVTLVVTCGGSEYGDTTSTSITLSLSGSGDKELKSFIDRTCKGRWVQLTISGNVANRPAFRDITIQYLPIRAGRTSS
jgi:hypothetical protein